MKFDPYCWLEVKPNEALEIPKGVLRLRASAPVALYASAQGYEVLVGYGATFEVEFAEAVKIRVDAAKGVRLFRYHPLSTTVHADGEVFTNIDRMPDESGSVAEVLRARRMFEFERRNMLAEIRAERDESLRLMRSAQRAAAPAEAAPAAADPAPGSNEDVTE